MARFIGGNLYQDANGYPIQVLSGSLSRVNLTAGASSSQAAVPTGTDRLLFVRATDWIWLNFGTSSGVTATAAATSLLFAPGEGVVNVPVGTTNIAVLRAGSADVIVQLESLR